MGSPPDSAAGLPVSSPGSRLALSASSCPSAFRLRLLPASEPFYNIRAISALQSPSQDRSQTRPNPAYKTEHPHHFLFRSVIPATVLTHTLTPCGILEPGKHHLKCFPAATYTTKPPRNAPMSINGGLLVHLFHNYFEHTNEVSRYHPGTDTPLIRLLLNLSQYLTYTCVQAPPTICPCTLGPGGSHSPYYQSVNHLSILHKKDTRKRKYLFSS